VSARCEQLKGPPWSNVATAGTMHVFKPDAFNEIMSTVTCSTPVGC
jgi:hypothetical protein